MHALAIRVSLLAIALFVVGRVLDLQLLHLLTKPVPALALAAWVARSVESRHGRLAAAGLVLSALGDFLLDLGSDWFVAGLAAFLVAHLLYVASFVADAPALCPRRAAPFVLYGVFMMAFLWSGLGSMRLPVTLYTIAICTMLWRASARVGSHGAPKDYEWIGVLGAVAFAASDSLIALDRFWAPIPMVRVPILALYWAGQYGIARSIRGITSNR